ncbi:uroporphyrinogen decarboxylase [Agrococcus sp. HG114]|uniref:uroporphyrinogen decarboxylase n=1 Tax=Agrococcus sp. HG114 TaxID=2969757 RepID=UPI00215A8BE2|nr:uroporphyrinogen decarboxylase [Agrococcus sp. HG114]MCR8671941.1 uroporphyrinogen decarboxylase [Agrococcus sp. HG114]
MPALPETHPLNTRTGASPLVRAYRGDRPETTPVWFMRQAGRSLPEYRELRARTDGPGRDMLDTCLDPALASEITLQPVRRHGVDAAIFFSDIMVPLRLAGVDVRIEPGVGPVVATPIRTPDDVERLVANDPASLDTALEPVREGVRRTIAGLAEIGDGTTPLIGFAGAPFTLAAYLVAGRPSKDHLEARTLMRAHPDAWDRLTRWCADVTGRFLRAQVEEGASAAQLFDSWAGSLPLEQYREHVAPASRLALDRVRDLADASGRRVPLVHFGVGAGELYGAMDLDVDAIGVDWRVPLDVALERIDADVTVQGNLDPAVLGAPWEIIVAAIDHVMLAGSVARAHVFNLGHGVPPTADPAVLTRIVQAVHAR